MNSLLTPGEIELAFRGHNLHLSLPVKKDIVQAIIEYHQKHLANMTPEFRESMILTLMDYKGFDRAPTETIVDCLLPLIKPLVEQAVKDERARLAELAHFPVKTTGGISSMNADYWSRLKWALQKE